MKNQQKHQKKTKQRRENNFPASYQLHRVPVKDGNGGNASGKCSFYYTQSHELFCSKKDACSETGCKDVMSDMSVTVKGFPDMLRLVVTLRRILKDKKIIDV